MPPNVPPPVPFSPAAASTLLDGISRARRDADTFDVRGALRSILDASRVHWRTVALTMALTLAVVLGYVAVWPPTYSADATIMGERDVDASRDTFYGGWNVFRKDDHRTELELMVSGPVLSEVVRKLGLTHDEVYHPFTSHLVVLWEGSFVGRQYRAAKAWLFPPDPGDAAAEEARRFGRIVVDLRAGISLVPVHEAIVGRLTVKGPTPRVAEIANTIVDVYQRQRTERYTREARQAVDVLTAEVRTAADELRALEQARLTFARENALTFDLQKENEDLKALGTLERDMASARVRVAALESGLAEVLRQIEAEPATQTTARVFELNTQREIAKAKRLELQTALLSLRNRYREDSPEVREALADIAKVDQLLSGMDEQVEKGRTEQRNQNRQSLQAQAGTMRSELAQARASLEVMELIAARSRERLGAVPALQRALRGFDRDLLLAQEKYSALAAKRAQAAVSVVTTQSAVPSIRVVEYATAPSERSWPRLKLLIPATLVAGLLMGMLAAQVRRFAAGRVRRGHWGRRAGDALVYGSVAVSTAWQPLVLVRPGSGRPS